ncbi:uncharacterized calcium-binding protein At1g02270 isoform X1 [Eucalyptus grandis]|uniref:uncharacterized calcium-binding protein At1g02270 isoform X1 n=1 Tax=Eucalyptus grandis TaxID=71139 RepID=UPI00192E9F93|nr:uncharacterized calcium-binding protein At1g02270 isoform X1 [Eucalyptus grandis]
MRKERRRSSKMEGRVSRIGSYAIASSVGDRQHPCITCTTFNILAPIYKRSNRQDPSCRESDCRANWLARNHRILDWLLNERSSIICLQEFWVGNEELVNMYEKRLGDAGYTSYKLARTNNRGDGLLIAVRKDYFRVIKYKELLFYDCGDRVAQLLHVELVAPFPECRSNDVRQEILIVNTHLLFPHDSSFCIVRLHQVYKILQSVESYQKENNLNSLPIILCGDWNGSKRGHVYKFLRSQGFVSSYDTAHQYTDADAQKWVSHRNHRGNICGVDFIWLLNPNSYRKLLKTSWIETVFGIFKCLLREALLTENGAFENGAFAILKADNADDFITYLGFCKALKQFKLTGHSHGLSAEETKDLWVQVDIDGDGVVNFEEFKQQIWNPSWSEQRTEEKSKFQDGKGCQKQTIGFSVKNAVLFPPEVEKGRWPENYSLSDHARLTVVFSPIKMPCSQLIS